MSGQTNSPPLNNEANVTLPRNLPMPSRSVNQPVPQPNDNSCHNYPVAENNSSPPPYTPDQTHNKLPPSIYGDNLGDPTYKEMIVIMGVRGAGKSYFINQMAGGDVATTGDGSSRCTVTCQAVPTRFGRSKVILIDTPGFDGTNSTEAVVCAEISRVLAVFYKRGVSLRGFIYLQRITEKVVIGSAASVQKMFRSLCGETKLLKNTILVTTGWQLQKVDEAQGAVQERELRKFWGQMLHQGSTMVRYYGDRNSGVGIVSQILGNEDIPFETEAELIARGKQVERRANIAGEMARLQQELDELTLS